MIKNLELRGGYKDEDGVFHCKRTEVVREDRLGAFMRQDDQFRALPVTYIAETQEPVTRYFA